MKTEKNGTLYVVATPIGNLSDLSKRMLLTLKEVDLIAAEDTRVSAKLIQLAFSTAKCLSYHKFNEKKTSGYLIDQLKQGKNIALVSDAGTPGIADPGFILVQDAHEADIPVVSVPGPCSVTSACSISGFDCNKFIFMGFFPKKEQEMRQLFETLNGFPGALVFFEAPHRLKKTLKLLLLIYPETSRICLCKETTKKFEKIFRGSLSSVSHSINEIETIKGEWTLILESLPLPLPNEKMMTVLEVSDFFSVNRSTASKILAIVSKKSRQDIYRNS